MRRCSQLPLLLVALDATPGVRLSGVLQCACIALLATVLLLGDGALAAQPGALAPIRAPMLAAAALAGALWRAYGGGADDDDAAVQAAWFGDE